MVFHLNNVIKVFPGEIFGFEDIQGSTLLVQFEDEFNYVYIGDHIDAFKTTEPINRYVSYMGNNLVPYA